MFWIGLQLEERSLKWAKIHKKGKKLYITELKEAPLSEESPVNPLYISPKEEPFTYVVSGLSSEDVLFRELPFTGLKKKNLYKILPFQIEPLLPYSPAEAVVVLQTSTPSPSFFTTKISVLLSHKETWQGVQIEPDEISCVPMALQRFATYFFPEEESIAVLHMDLHTTTIVYQNKGKILFSHTLSLGYETLSSREEEELLRYKRELDRVFVGLQQKPACQIENILLTGWFSSLADQNFLFLPEDAILLPCSNDLASYAIPIGLALDGSLLDRKSVFFSQNRFSSRSLQKKRKRFFLLFISAACFLTTVNLTLGTFYLHKQKNQLYADFSTVTKTDDVPSSLEELQEALLQNKKLFL